MKEFGLIGRPLKHSYSKKIHAYLGEYHYDLYEIQPDTLKDFITNSSLNGFNVTIPYKKDVMAYLDNIDERAQKIGAVNTVVVKDGLKTGYNTDFDGMVYMLSRAKISLLDKTVLIMGSGGTSNTARAVCEYLGAKEIKILSRSGEVNYGNYEKIAPSIEVIINTTPVGTYPDNYSCKIDLNNFPKLMGVADVVYNPSLTKLLYQAEKLGVRYTNGLPMLVAQAKYAKDLFLGEKSGDAVIEDIISVLEKEKKNIVLIGMPGCGKTSVGVALSKELNREFIDIDQEIVKKDGRDIPTIFSESGEEYFRKLESEVLKEVGVLTGKIIVTGGGVVKNADNYFPLKQNGIIVWIDREIEKLATNGRPLSKDLCAVKKLYRERKELYESFADIKIKNDGSILDAVNEVNKHL